MRTIRQRHQNLCVLVQQGDEMFSSILAVLYSCNISMACLLSYNLLDHKATPIQFAIQAFWTITMFLNFIGISVIASFLNSEVGTPLYHSTIPCISSQRSNSQDQIANQGQCTCTGVASFLTYCQRLVPFLILRSRLSEGKCWKPVSFSTYYYKSLQ